MIKLLAISNKSNKKKIRQNIGQYAIIQIILIKNYSSCVLKGKYVYIV